MQVPGADRAIIDRSKLEDYLLSASHPVGRFKAHFFAKLGFSAERWDLFDKALREQHLTQPVHSGGADEFGRSFAIRAILKGPTGASAAVISVWHIRTGEEHPRLVTAYPGGDL